MKICVDIKKLNRIVFPLSLTTVLVLLHLASTSVIAQSDILPDDIRFEHINIETGLASSTVSAITQDQEGFIWFGTTQGLNRFDGYEYLLFGKNSNDPSRDIGRNRILSLHADDDGDTLWIGSDYLIQHSTIYGTSTRYMDVSDGSGIDVIVPDNNGNLLLSGHQLGLRIFNIASKEIVSTHYFEPQSEGGKSNTINDLVVSDDGLVWMATASGVYMFNPKTAQFSRPAILLGLTDLHISSIEIDALQRIWIGSWSGLHQYDYNNGRFTSFTQEQTGFEQIHSLLVDSNNRVWIGSDKQGVSAFDPGRSEFIHYAAGDTNPYAIGGGAVIDIYEDDVESVWFSVQGYGVYRYNPNAQLFDLYLADPIDPNALGHQQVSPIVVDGANTAWVGTDGGGLYALKEGTDKFISYRHDEEDVAGLSSDAVLSIVHADNHLWIGSWGGGLSHFNIQADEFVHWTIEDGLLTNNIFTLYRDTQNRLWISAWDHGVQLLDIKSGELIDDPFPVYTQRGETDKKLGLQNVSIMAILEANDGTMWFGGYGGLEQYNPRTGLFRPFLANDDPNVRYEISSNTIFVLHEDKNGTIWVGTDTGLNRIDPVTGVISAYTVSDGLPDNVVVGILEDEDGDLWLSTKRGVSLFRQESEKFQNFSMNTGLQGEEFNRFSFTQENGLMYFGGTSGFNRFDPIKVKQTSQSDTPPIKLTDFSLAGTSVHPDPNNPEQKNLLAQTINTADKITLSANDDMFSIKFAALEYTRPEQMRYQYTLEGNDDNWIERSSDERIATYTNIEPGTYTFRVRALSVDGSPSPEEASIKIVIDPHWWETGWFNVLFATSIMIALVVGYRLHLRATTDKLEIGQKEREANIYRRKNSELQRVNEKLLMLNQEKDDMLGIVAHDLHNPLGVMLMNLDLLISHHDKLSQEKRKRKLKQVEQMVRTTHEMADRLLTKGREKGITAEIEPVPIMPILDELSQQYEMKAIQKQIKLEQKWYTHRQIGVAADPTMLRQVLDNLISNAIKYSHPNSSVLLHIEQMDSVVSIIVQDRGQGMTAEDLEHVFGRYAQLSAKPTNGERSVGMGLFNVKTLVDAMNGEVIVASEGRNKGCTFTVRLPRATVGNTSTPMSPPTFRAAKRPAQHHIIV